MLRINLSKVFKYIAYETIKLFYSIDRQLTQSICRFMSSLPNYETLKLSQPKPYVTLVELNRPKKLNAINKQLFE